MNADLVRLCVSLYLCGRRGGLLVSASQPGCSALIHIHISYLRLSNKSCMLIQSASQSQETSVCVLTNDVSFSLSNGVHFFPRLSSFDWPVLFLLTTTTHFRVRDVWLHVKIEVSEQTRTKH